MAPSRGELLVADEPPGIAGVLRKVVTGALQSEGKMPLSILAIAVYEDAEGNQGWSWVTGEDQTGVTSMGLMNLLGRAIEHDFHDTYFPREEGE